MTPRGDSWERGQVKGTAAVSGQLGEPLANSEIRMANYVRTGQLGGASTRAADLLGGRLDKILYIMWLIGR